MVLTARPATPTPPSPSSARRLPDGGRATLNLRHDWLRVSQRLAAGMSPREVAHAERRDEAAIQGLLAQDGFRELVASWEALAAKPPEEQIRQLVVLARQAIYNALADWDVGAAFVVLREDERGRDPAVTLAKGVVASCRRAAHSSAAAPPPSRTEPPVGAASPARPRSPAHPGDQLVQRGAARLRRAVADELAVRHAATTAVAAETTPTASPPGGGAATVAAAPVANLPRHPRAP